MMTLSRIRMSEHHDRPPSEIMLRYKFHTQTHTSAASISAYIAVLHALGQRCGFGDCGAGTMGLASVQSE